MRDRMVSDTGAPPTRDAGSSATGCEDEACPESESLWTFGTATGDNARAVAIGTDGNLYVTGWTDEALDFGGEPDTPFGDNDIVLVSFTPALEHRWHLRLGGPSGEDPRALVVDSGGDLHLVGSFAGTAAFGAVELTSLDTDVFLARVTASGTVVGAESFGGADHQWARDVVLAPDGSRVIVGSFLGSMTVGSDSVDSAGGTDAFVASVASDGTISWWRTVGGTEDDVYRAVAIDDAGNVYVAGDFAGSVDVAGSTLDAGSSPFNGLLVSYGPSGDARWAVKLGDDYTATAMDVAWTPADEVLVAMDAGGDLAVVLVTYASTGEELSLRGWADGIHRGGHGELRSLAFDGAGNLYVAGSFTGRLAFASDLVLEDSDPTLSFSDGFVVSFTPTGLPRWGRSVGGPGDDWVSGLAVDPSGDLVAVTGAFERAVDFGVDTVESAGSWDGFLLVMH